jgi:hypothetical protein
VHLLCIKIPQSHRLNIVRKIIATNTSLDNYSAYFLLLYDLKNNSLL